ncbi:MAG: hypothetical protein H7061_07850 [Bdellovibrionaceae bacterium]|nr:hypothetical protein [Bdellovibrio sp.]
MNNIMPLAKKSLIIMVCLALFFWIFIFNWSFVFKKKVVGEVVAAERVGALTIVTNSGPINPQAFSFSVAIKDRKTGEIYMASSEDRQWAAVQKGNCVIAAYFPYPPWNMSKGSTDHNARLLRNFTTCNELPPTDSFFDSLRFFFLWI